MPHENHICFIKVTYASMTIKRAEYMSRCLIVLLLESFVA